MQTSINTLKCNKVPNCS